MGKQIDKSPPDESCNVTEAFIRALFEDFPDGSFLLGWDLISKKSLWFNTPDELAKWMLGKKDVFFGCACASKNYGSMKRCPANEVMGIFAFWMDIDYGESGHKGKKYPPTEQDAIDLATSILPPTVIIHSGHGLQIWWFFKEPWIFENNEDRLKAACLLDRWQAAIRARAKEKGWTFDATQDLARVLRAPGTHNNKNGDNIPVRVIESETDYSRRYAIDDFEMFIPENIESTITVSSIDRKTSYEKHFPKKKFEALLAADERFQKTWERNRPDLPDQSPSGYEMALANYAVMADWEDNEIAALLFEWRKRHGIDKAKLDRDDYISRTIAKARENSGTTNHEMDNPTAKQCKALTDVWNAKLFAKHHTGKALYCHPLKTWFIYDGRRWKHDDKGAIVQFAKETTREIFRIAAKKSSDEEREKYSKHAVKSQHKARIDAMIQLAQDELPVLPNQFDNDPFLFNLENGTLNIRTGKLQAHSPNDFISKISFLQFDPSAKAPLWNSFLSEIFSGNRNLITYLQLATGYAMTGDVRHDCLFIFHGTGCNGKTTFLTAIQNMMGEYARQMPHDLLIKQRHSQHPTGFMELLGTRFMPGSEVDEESAFDEALIKKLTGGDVIKGRGMYQNFIEFAPTHKFFIAVNHLPMIFGLDEGIWRRIRVIPFNVRISEIDYGFRLKLQNELPGILNWALEGAIAWYRGNGEEPALIEPPEVSQAIEEYRGKADLVAQFFADRGQVGPQFFISSSLLYEKYSEWCVECRHQPISQTAFGSCLNKRGFVSKKTGGKMIRLGIALKDVPNDSE